MMRLSGSNTNWFSVLLALLAAVAMVGCGGGGGSSSGSSSDTSLKVVANETLSEESAQVKESLKLILDNSGSLAGSLRASSTSGESFSDNVFTSKIAGALDVGSILGSVLAATSLVDVWDITGTDDSTWQNVTDVTWNSATKTLTMVKITPDYSNMIPVNDEGGFTYGVDFQNYKLYREIRRR